MIWDGRLANRRMAAAGIYVVRLRVGDRELEHKVQLLR
jgi:hypothetical protein